MELVKILFLHRLFDLLFYCLIVCCLPEFTSILLDGDPHTCLVMSVSAPADDIYETFGFLHLIRRDISMQHILVELKVRDISHCSNTNILHTMLSSDTACWRMRRCSLVEDRMFENICVWKCYCEGNLLCHLDILLPKVGGFVWQLCGVKTVLE